MRKMLINTADELRVATTIDGHLSDLLIERASLQERKSNIYKGKISSIEPSLDAVFVDYGAERHGFLPFSQISEEYFLCPIEEAMDNATSKSNRNTESRDDANKQAESQGKPQKPGRPSRSDSRNRQKPNLEKLLKRGQEVVVQIQKDERGSKGAALTTYISLAGAYLVLMPNNPKGGGISRRIEGEEREQIRTALDQLNLPDGMSIIIRTAGVGREQEELEWDMASLLRYWDAVKQAAVAKPAPYLIHKESDTLIRALRDYLRDSTNEIVTDSAETYERAKEYIAQIKPDLISRLKLYSGSTPLFSHFQIEKQIETAYQREVRLPSGASIVIDHSEALIAIDINSSRATEGGGIEETALNINLEAAEEIARQLRIRDIGGLIVIDFIDMLPAANQRKVEDHLRKCLTNDRARVQIGRISRFGLLEMSRQRLRSSLNKVNQITCPRCNGQGTIRSVESLALSLLHLLQEQSAKSENMHYQIQLPINVATYLMNEKRGALLDIEQTYNVQITIAPNQHLDSPQYHIKRTKIAPENKRSASYRLVKAPKIDAVSETFVPAKSHSAPAITEFLTEKTPPPKRKEPGLITRLWNLMFGGETAKSKPAPRRQQRHSGQRRHSNQRRRSGGNRQQTRRHHDRRDGGGSNPRKRSGGPRHSDGPRSRPGPRPQGKKD